MSHTTIRPALAAKLLAVFAAAMFVGCAEPATSDAPLDDPDRAPLGKRDHLGTCENTDCDGPSADGSCYCDEACTSYGDCCDDKVSVCDAPTGQICGGFAGFPCADDEYCAFPLSASCGWADATGVCEKRPTQCTTATQEVCGCDGTTYKNSCYAAAFGTGVVSMGACPDPGNGSPDSCVGKCGENAGNCYCDDQCDFYGDCCTDYTIECAPEPDREPVSGQCIRNQGSCATDADCTIGGCGSELCFNPADGGGITTCDCPSPAGDVDGCGCVEGVCSWYVE